MTFDGQPLTDIAAILNVSVGRLANEERPDVLALTAETSSAEVLRLRLSHLEALCRAYGEAVTLEVLTNEIPEISVTGAQVSSDDLDHLHQVASRSDDLFGVQLRIDKELLRRQLGLDRVSSLVRLFFFSQALERELAQSPRDFEQRVWTDPTRHLLLAVGDTDLRIERPALTVFGGRYLGDLELVINRSNLSSELARLADRRDHYIGWDSGIDTRLTPLHFAPSVQGELAPGPLGTRIDGLAVGLGALYVCDRARQPVHAGLHGVQLEYRGREHVAYVPLAWTDAASVAERAGPHVAGASVDLISWCYQVSPERPETDMLEDRLPFVQTRIAQLLESRAEADRSDALAAAMPSLLENAKWHWQAFIEGRINTYLEQVAGLESSISETVDKLEMRTTVITAKLIDTALAAVATLVGSFIAAAFHSPFNTRLFEVAMSAYVAYVVVFPGIIGVSSAYGTGLRAMQDFEPRKTNVSEVLGSQRADALIGNRVDNAWCRFVFWARVSSLIYALAAASGAGAAFLVPQLVL